MESVECIGYKQWLVDTKLIPDDGYVMKYEYKDDHLFITYVNNETFTEDDVFDFEVTFEDEQTIVLKDTAGGDEITYVRQ